jgi:hypothetical protein
VEVAYQRRTAPHFRSDTALHRLDLGLFVPHLLPQGLHLGTQQNESHHPLDGQLLGTTADPCVFTLHFFETVNAAALSVVVLICGGQLWTEEGATSGRANTPIALPLSGAGGGRVLSWRLIESLSYPYEPLLHLIDMTLSDFQPLLILLCRPIPLSQTIPQIDDDFLNPP